MTGTIAPADISSAADTNTLFMVAIGSESICLPEILDGLRQIHGKYTQGRHDREITLRVFLQPCEIIV